MKLSSRSTALPGLLATLVLGLAAGAAQAEKADRGKPLNISSKNGGSVEIAKQRTEFNGDVVLSKGSLVLRAEKLDVRETGDGYHQVYANGQTGKQVSFRQARDIPGEAIEGLADQLEYDTRSDTVRFIGNAVVRRLQGTTVADEVTGAVILFDNRSEVFTLEGGQSSPHPSGRVRVVMMPRGAASEPAATPASGIQLKPSTSLSPRKTP
ncbi:lipopolysaccharide transport periplasmic protein LptA [Paucibacter sp. DJ2R-2]|uniref:lipopolysaccharide transport periplasmic protein LptA n=1 Tax=unclassified Roseateles TaxID=2626991 RepID=UPI0021E48716|nr:lipopolysaccharide transport periplasmic protein LptA [Paucibacter sp. DJ2R-2]MCV2419543.1 lipopolysaccharide transport periplasmic protein LptA [Paucibacter sp. DJ4R-1]MCV2437554.1 lipopolysaccharide transport periplasmic protein LptA [Paucibacter sp. DJ2R-2]